jgi:hypothetical protein
VAARGGFPTRKRFKRKRRSCALCKPHKRGWDTRWKPKEAAKLKRFERDRQYGWRDDCS